MAGTTRRLPLLVLAAVMAAGCSPSGLDPQDARSELDEVAAEVAADTGVDLVAAEPEVDTTRCASVPGLSTSKVYTTFEVSTGKVDWATAERVYLSAVEHAGLSEDDPGDGDLWMAGEGGQGATPAWYVQVRADGAWWQTVIVRGAGCS